MQIFTQKYFVVKWFFKISYLELLLSHTILGIFLENKLFQIWNKWKGSLIRNVFYSKIVTRFQFQTNLMARTAKIMTLKIGFLQFLRGWKELEVIDIKKLFDYKLSMGKCLHTVKCYAWNSTTVDTLVCILVNNSLPRWYRFWVM